MGPNQIHPYQPEPICAGGKAPKGDLKNKPCYKYQCDRTGYVTETIFGKVRTVRCFVSFVLQNREAASYKNVPCLLLIKRDNKQSEVQHSICPATYGSNIWSTLFSMKNKGPRNQKHKSSCWTKLNKE